MTIAKSSKNHGRRRKRSSPPRPDKRTPNFSGKPVPSDTMTCTQVLTNGLVCGKKCYRSRKEAKTAARMIYPGQSMRFYPCAGYHHMTSADSATSEQIRRDLAVGAGVFVVATPPLIQPGRSDAAG